MCEVDKAHQYYKWYDGWFTYYVNVKTGKKKFFLEEGDVLVDHETDDFIYEEK